MSEERKDEDRAEQLQAAYKVTSVEQRRKLYREWAATYDEQTLNEFGWIGFREAARRFAEFVPDKAASILDAGCGTGLSGVALAELGYENLHGADLSPEMLAVAQKTGAYQTLQEADLTQPLPGDLAYDAIYCAGVFGFGPPHPEHLVHLVNALSPGGHAVLTVNGKGWAETGWEEKLPEIVSAHSLNLAEQSSIDYLKNEQIKGILLVFRA